MKLKNIIIEFFLELKKIYKKLKHFIKSSLQRILEESLIYKKYKTYKRERFYAFFIILLSLIASFQRPPVFEAFCKLEIIQNFIKFCIEYNVFLLLQVYYGLMISILKLFSFIGLIVFTYWVFVFNLIFYIAIEHEEHQTEEFKIFQKIRKRRWIIFPILFFLLFPNVLLGQDLFVVPFFDNAHKLVDPFVVKKLYLDNDGYYNDFLYMHVLKAYENDANALKIAAYYDDWLYVGTINFIAGAQLVLITYQIYEDWIYPFELFVRKNMRKTSFFKFVAKICRAIKNWLKEKIIFYDPDMHYFFDYILILWRKYIKRNFIIFDEEEYEEYYKKALNKYCINQQASSIYIKIVKNFFVDIYNFMKDEISRYKNLK